MRSLFLSLCLVPLLGRADVVLVDRIVATVDLHAITRSSIEARARPMLAVAKNDAQKDELRKAALIELIEDQLIRKEAERLSLEVRNEEVEAALNEVAKQNQLSLTELFAEIKRQGLDADQYKSMLRSKLLELRWLNLRMNHSAMPADEAARGAFMGSERARLMNELRAAAVIEVRS